MQLISKSGSMPLVELFKRLPDTNELVSVNQTLIHEVFLAKKNNEDKSFINKTKNQELNKENASATTNSVKLPPVGEYCDIHITWAANPFNFMVCKSVDFFVFSQYCLVTNIMK